MPKIAKDEFGNKKIRSVIGGRASVVCYEKDPLLWQYRQKKEGSKDYIYRVLNEPDLGRAARRAEELYLDLRNQDKPSNTPIKNAINEWIQVKEERQISGQITESTVKGAISSLRTAVLLYLTKYKKLQKVSEIKQDTFMEYSSWRMTHAWKDIERSTPKAPPKLSTIKRDIALIHDWYANFLIPKAYATSIPSLESIIIRQDQMDANPPIPLDTDWPLIYRYFEKWADEPNHGMYNAARVGFYRQMVRHFVLICYNSGCRPKELLGIIEKQRLPHPEGGWTIRDLVKGGLRWCDVEVEPQTHTTASGKDFDFLEAVLYIRESKTGVPREIPTNTGKYFVRWRKFCDQYRKEQGLPKLTPQDFVFFNPHNERPYPYSQVTKSWQAMRTNLSLVLKGSKSSKPYTLYSLRSSYITNQIDEGKDVYLIKKITGHSLEILNRHYDRSDLRKRRAEATARTYGVARTKSKKIDLSKLDSVEVQSINIGDEEIQVPGNYSVDSYGKTESKVQKAMMNKKRDTKSNFKGTIRN